MKLHTYLLLPIAASLIACFLASASARAQFAQDAPKFAGAGAFGYSVSLSSDGNTAIVGGPTTRVNSSPITFALGSARVFTRSDGVWSQQQEIPSPHGEFFGFSVSLSADGNTAVVGAPLDVADDHGYASVYVRSAGIWERQAFLSKTFYTASGLLEGYSVSLSADGNTAIVGAPGVTNFPSIRPVETGAGLVFTRSTNGDWTLQAELVGSDVNGMFNHTHHQGNSVALSADGNTAVVGGLLDGRVASWVFIRGANGEWSQEAVLDDVGSFVALSNNGNTAMFGNASGAVVYARLNIASGIAWNPVATLAGTGAPATLLFGAAPGYSVSLSADGNAAMVGTSVFTRSGGGWTQQELAAGTGAVGAAAQGFSVALSANGSTSIVGGPNDKNGAGAAWVYSELMFPGEPGTPNCHGQRITGLSRKYAGLVSASIALGFASVRDLQSAVAEYCSEMAPRTTGR